MEDDNNNHPENNNSTVESSDKISSTNEMALNESGSTNLRLHVTPNSNSSISFVQNEQETALSSSPLQDSEGMEIPDESHLVERIEVVRNNPDGLMFRIKLIDHEESEWIQSKIANRKYPQAVIAFWENHVEFT